MKTSDAVAFFGTKKAIAQACSDDGWPLTAAAVTQWGDYPPTGRQKQLESLTSGRLKAADNEQTQHKPDPEVPSGQTMTDNRVEDLNIESIIPLVTPHQLKEEMPISESAVANVRAHRQVIRDILDRKDHRIFVVIGPCSIHDVDAAMDYARRLRDLAEEVSDTLFLVMRVYFEKPRTTVGWKGLINDPYMNDS